MLKKMYSIALLVAISWSCSDSSWQEPTTSKTAVFNGQTASPATLPGVFYVYGGCTAVLVARGRLLTAGHCFYFESEEALQNPINRKVFYEALGRDYPITRIIRAPFRIQNQLRVNPDDYNRPAFDLAIIEFDDRGEIPQNHALKIAPQDFDASFTQFRKEVVIAGYGWVDSTLSTVDESKTVPRKLQQGSMYWVSKWGIHGQEMYLSGPSNGCSGDSGGPIIMNDGSQRLLVGIDIATTTFYLDKRCGVDDSIATNLGHAAVRSWIASKSGNLIPL